MLERIRAYRQYYQFYSYGIWVICLKENDRMIGLAGFSNLEVEGKFCLDLGYVLDSPYRHQGYALEACRGILDFVGRYFDDREEGEIIPVICQIKPDNQPSIRLAEKLGFQKWKENNGLVIWRMMREEPSG